MFSRSVAFRVTKLSLKWTKKSATRASGSASGLVSSSVCWKCDESTADQQGATALFCGSCEVIQPLDIGDTDMFALFSMNRTFNVDKTSLEASFKGLQKVLHPDKFATKTLQEREASATASSTVNQAYQILKGPVERARYLLQLHGFRTLDEGGDTIQNPALMMEMFSVREEVEEADDANALNRVKDRMSTAVDEACVALQHCLDQHEIDSLPEAAVRLKYCSKVLEEITARKDELGISPD